MYKMMWIIILLIVLCCVVVIIILANPVILFIFSLVSGDCPEEA